MRTVLIDNHDSFTYNLFHLLVRVDGRAPLVVANDDRAGLDAIEWPDVDAIVVSPGPGNPAVPTDLGISRWAVEQDRIPVLGVCLGFQALCRSAGARVSLAPEPVHGRRSAVRHAGTGLLAGIPSPFEVVRYHSLAVYDLPVRLDGLAHTEDGVLMAVADRAGPRWGVQFHPESILTEYGELLLANFRDLAGRGPVAPPPPPPPAAPPPPAPPPPPVAPERTAPAGYRLHVRELAAGPDAETAFVALFAGQPGAFWLDSSRVVDGTSRYSMLGDAGGPLGELISYDVASGTVRVTDPAGRPTGEFRESVFDHLERMQARRAVRDPGLPFDFCLGYVGYLGYELKADCGASAAHRAATPDAAFAFCCRAVVYDHRTGRRWLLALSRDADSEAAAGRWLDGATARLAAATAPPAVGTGPAAAPVTATARHGAAEYAALIEECQRQITAGESYEICLTTMLSVPCDTDPLTVYRVLRAVNPAPYSALLCLPGLAVLSCSPERFLRIGRDRTVESKPIKGTRPRGGDPARDARLADELRGSEKDRAENLMIVDLVRNDLGRSCVPAACTYRCCSTWRATGPCTSSSVRCAAGCGPTPRRPPAYGPRSRAGP